MKKVVCLFLTYLFIFLISPGAFSQSVNCSYEAVQKRDLSRWIHYFEFQNVKGKEENLKLINAYLSDIQVCHEALSQELNQAIDKICLSTPKEISIKIKSGKASTIEREMVPVLPSYDDDEEYANLQFESLFQQNLSVGCKNVIKFATEMDLSGLMAASTRRPVDIDSMIKKYFPSGVSHGSPMDLVKDTIDSANRELHAMLKELKESGSDISEDQIATLLQPYDRAIKSLENATHF